MDAKFLDKNEMTGKSDYVITVALADDHWLFRSGVKNSLSSRQDIKVIGEAENGLQLLELLKKIQPDVILLDITMPIMDGLATLAEIKRLYPNIKVIILSMHNDHSMINRMMEIGANSYLSKEADSETIFQAIKICYEQGFCFNDLTNKALLGELRTKSIPNASTPQEIELTEKQITILKLMCDEKNIKEIAEIVDLSPRTVEAILEKLKTKTGIKSMTGLMMYAIKAGIVTQEEKKNEGGEEIYNLSKEQMIKLFSLSTSILAYINHDLSGQRNLIYYALSVIKEQIGRKQGKQPQKDNYVEINNIIEKGLDATATISSIINVIRSHFYLNSSSETTDFNKLFISQLEEIVEMVRQRNKKVKIDIDKTSQKSLEIVYPPKIFFSILSELAENAKKVAPSNLKILIKWKMEGNNFQCEVHDNGPGFLGLRDKKFVPLESLVRSKDGKITGMGLNIINRTILDSGGHLFFSHSKILNGAMIYFEFPVIDFKYKTSDKK